MPCPRSNSDLGLRFFVCEDGDNELGGFNGTSACVKQDTGRGEHSLPGGVTLVKERKGLRSNNGLIMLENNQHTALPLSPSCAPFHRALWES